MLVTPGDEKVSMLTHAFRLLRKVKWLSAITRLTADFMGGLMSDLMICKHGKEHGPYMGH